MRLFDLGGSGVKTAIVDRGSDAGVLTDNDVIHYPHPDWGGFPHWASRLGLLTDSLIGIACAGFVVPDSVVRLFRIGGWRNRPLVNEISAMSPSSQVYLLNDAEAHLMAHVRLFELPCMSITLGTSFGFAISDEQGRIIRPPDGMNFDLGEIAIPTRARNNRVWWALGSEGLLELEHRLGKDKGMMHFGGRLGAFLVSLCSIYRPKTVVLGGGIIESGWGSLEQAIVGEFASAQPAWLATPRIVKSPYGRRAALVGMAVYVSAQQN